MGEREAPGIRARQSRDGYGFRHDWVPMQFDDHMIKVQIDQDADGHRHVEESMRVWNSDLGRDIDHLGRPDIDIEYLSGTREMRQATGAPLVAYPNAGLPITQGDQVTYELGPEAMAKDYPALLDVGASIVGGCCGSGPEHIRLIAEVVRARRSR